MEVLYKRIDFNLFDVYDSAPHGDVSLQAQESLVGRMTGRRGRAELYRTLYLRITSPARELVRVGLLAA